jgi:hypothetical protein
VTAKVDDRVVAMWEARMDDPEPQVMIEVVEATMSSPMLRDEPVLPIDPVEGDLAPAPVPETPILTPTLQPMTVARRVELAIVVAVTVAAWFIAADMRVAIGVGSIGIAAVSIRWINRHVSFSFGQGFVGYRADLGWPRGIQEDDDVRWNWRGSTALTGSPDAPQRSFVKRMDKAPRGR